MGTTNEAGAETISISTATLNQRQHKESQLKVINQSMSPEKYQR